MSAIPSASSSLPARAAAPALEARGLRVVAGEQVLLDGIDLALASGWTAIVGPNGAGKSTLLRALAGVLAPQAGTVALQGQPLSAWPGRERARRLAWLPQAGAHGAAMTVRETVALGRLPHRGLTGAMSAADARAVERALAEVDAMAWADRLVDTLSGGERQRVLLARVLATEAEVLLLDEPAAHLDPPQQVLLARLCRRLGGSASHTSHAWPESPTSPESRVTRPPATVVTVLHDLSLALAADRVVVLDRGRVLAHGAAADPHVAQALHAVFAGALSLEIGPQGAVTARLRV